MKRLGLALGSGSARGWAHIGVIQCLQEAGISIDIVCGTSIGALVGGALAGGSVVLRRGHRHGRWSWRPNRAGLSRYEGPSRTTQEAPGSVPSPGGWEVPPGLRPMWDWTPPGGGRPRLDRVPAIVRAWYELPFVDRYAHAWMWHHGGWDIASPSGPAGDSAGGA